MRLGEKVAIVTGGARGIGKAITLRLAADGFRVAIVYNRSADEARKTAVDVEAKNGDALVFKADVSQPAQVKALRSYVLEAYGRIDLLVNNAGVATKSATVDLSEDVWDRVLDVNLKAAFLCSQAVIPPMQAQGAGRIINIASIAGQTGGAIGAHYAASKAGMIGLTRFMARELGPDKITVNAVAPSGVPTDLLRQLDLEPSTQRPIRRLGTPEDIAAAVSFLASDEAGFITGQVLGVNGGSFIG